MPKKTKTPKKKEKEKEKPKMIIEVVPVVLVFD
jgi:hypothetical protein